MSPDVDGSCLVQGLAVVAPKTAWSGPLTPWTLEEKLMRKYLHTPCDRFSVRVVLAVRLEEPDRLHCCWGKRGEIVPIAAPHHGILPYHFTKDMQDAQLQSGS